MGRGPSRAVRLDGAAGPGVEPSKLAALSRAYARTDGWVTVRLPDPFGATRIELSR